MPKYENNKEKGFTLIELSIVLIIISLIVGGVVGGKSLIHSAEIKSVISDYNSYRTSLNSFLLKYDYPPGDLPNASEYWTSCTDDGANTCNGNGDNKIRGYNEGIRAWQHLSFAKLINGTYSGITQANMPENTLPTTALNNSIYSINAFDTLAGLLGAFGVGPTYYGFFVGKWNSTSYFVNANISARDVKNIDIKIDDGLPGTNGNVGGFVSWMDAGISCINGTQYDVGNPDAKCVLVFKLDIAEPI